MPPGRPATALVHLPASPRVSPALSGHAGSSHGLQVPGLSCPRAVAGTVPLSCHHTILSFLSRDSSRLGCGSGLARARPLPYGREGEGRGRGSSPQQGLAFPSSPFPVNALPPTLPGPGDLTLSQLGDSDGLSPLPPAVAVPSTVPPPAPETAMGAGPRCLGGSGSGSLRRPRPLVPASPCPAARGRTDRTRVLRTQTISQRLSGPRDASVLGTPGLVRERPQGEGCPRPAQTQVKQVGVPPRGRQFRQHRPRGLGPRGSRSSPEEPERPGTRVLSKGHVRTWVQGGGPRPRGGQRPQEKPAGPRPDLLPQPARGPPGCGTM